MEKEEKHSYRMLIGEQSYLFDFREKKRGELSLKISKSQGTGSGIEFQRMIDLQEGVDDFLEAFTRAMLLFRTEEMVSDDSEANEQKALGNFKTFALEEINQAPHAYTPWSTEDDNKLETLYREGRKITELARIFKRNKGGIQNRINKLKLREKYGRVL